MSGSVGVAGYECVGGYLVGGRVFVYTTLIDDTSYRIAVV